MKEIRRKKNFAVWTAIIISYCTMYVLIFAADCAIPSINGIMWDHVFHRNLNGLFWGLLLALIPYEKIANYFGNWRIFAGGVVYAFLSYLFIWYSSISFRRLDVGFKVISFCLSIMIAWIITESFTYIRKKILLFLSDIVLIVINATVIFRSTRSFFLMFIISVALLIGFNFCNFIYRKSYKVVTGLASVVSGGLLLLVAKDCTRRFSAWSAWFRPEFNSELSCATVHQALRSHSLNIPAGISEIEVYNHPFLMIYSYLGVVAFIMFILAFIVITIAYISSFKLVSKKRYSLLTFIYFIYAVLYIYMLLADLGFVPTPTAIRLIEPEIYFVGIGIVIRLFINTTDNVNRRLGRNNFQVFNLINEKNIEEKDVDDDEVWDLYDENKNYLGKTCLRKQKDNIPQGSYHLAIWVYIITSDGGMLLTQRAENKSRALKWEPVGGCVISGEKSIECAVREVGEEISLDIKADKLKLFYEKKSRNEILEYYGIFVENINLEQLRLQEEEVKDIKIVDAKELRNMQEKEELVAGVYDGFSMALSLL